jgi:hypothetical protein
MGTKSSETIFDLFAAGSIPFPDEFPTLCDASFPVGELSGKDNPVRTEAGTELDVSSLGLVKLLS